MYAIRPPLDWHWERFLRGQIEIAARNQSRDMSPLIQYA